MGRQLDDNLTLVVPRWAAGGEPGAYSGRGQAPGRGPRHTAHICHQDRDTTHQGDRH